MMRIQNLFLVVGLTAALSISPLLHAQTQSAPEAAKPGAPSAQSFDPHNLTGTWIGYNWGLLRGQGKGPGGVTNYGLVDQTIPEPPLTDWGKQHLLYKAITHEPLAGTHLPGWDRPGHICPNTEDPCFSADQYGVLANQVEGEYSGKDCESMSTPAIYDLPYLGQIDLIHSHARRKTNLPAFRVSPRMAHVLDESRTSPGPRSHIRGGFHGSLGGKRFGRGHDRVQRQDHDLPLHRPL
jgi:hypothetical protein